MKKMLEWVALLAVFLALAGCAGKEAAEPKWEESLYRTVVYNSGEDESDAKYLEMWLSLLISQRKSPDYGIYQRI